MGANMVLSSAESKLFIKPNYRVGNELPSLHSFK